MEYSAKIDSRLLLECLSQGGMLSAEMPVLHAALAGLITGALPSPLQKSLSFADAGEEFQADAAFALLWDGILVKVAAPREMALGALLEKYSNNFDEAIQQRLKFETGRDLLHLNEQLKHSGATLDELRQGTRAIGLPLALALLDFYRGSLDRVIHEELTGLLVKPISDAEARARLGEFLLQQLPLPAKRVQRFTLCQALENLAEPALAPGLAGLALDPQYGSLRGRLCRALAKIKAPQATAVALQLLESGDEETKVWALEALSILRAKECAEKVRPFAVYQSADKEWTRAINKAADKTLKALGG